jgi:hypothetical protein
VVTWKKTGRLDGVIGTPVSHLVRLLAHKKESCYNLLPECLEPNLIHDLKTDHSASL